MKEPCLSNCKFKKNGKCSLYEVDLQMARIPDPYDEGEMEVCYKCVDCLEKELSSQLDDKFLDITSFFKAFTVEMNIILNEVNELVEKRRSIYK